MNQKRVASLVLLVFLLAACGGQPTVAPTMDVGAILTSSVSTFSAALFDTQTAQALSATPSPTSTDIKPTDTALALASPIESPTQGFVFNPASTLILTPSVTGTIFTPTPNPSSLALGCNNLALIRDETIPAGTVMSPLQVFTKTWKVENNGTCDWVYLYRLVFTGGNQMGGEPSGLGKVIPPGKWTQISVQLMAPKQPGSYVGTWRLGTQAGGAFGSTLTVSIVVASPSNTPVPATNTPLPTATNTPLPTNTNTPLPTNTVETPSALPGP